jgi:hypothetical protein
MKKLLLVISIVSAAMSASAQSCTPGANYADSVYGVWPDTVQNFPYAAVNVAYSTDLNFKVPAEVTAELDPTGGTLVGTPIQGFVVDSVGGLPAGMSYGCNISSCEYAGGANGCANLYGTPTATGTYPVEIYITATVLITIIPGFPPTPLPQSTSFSGYRIVVGQAGTIDAIYEPLNLKPNPANENVTLYGITPDMNISSVEVTNMEGKVVRALNIVGNSLEINLNGLNNGVYFVVVNHAGGKETIKFIKN